MAALTEDFLVHADETSFKPTTQTSKAFIWAFVGQSLTGYAFALTRGGDLPLDVLGGSTGAFLCDDYRGYDPLEKKGNRKRSGCLAHARRKYFEVGDVPEAHDALELVAYMYRIEHEAERRGILGTADHLALRRAYSRPLFVALLQLARRIRQAQGPKTLICRAANYTSSNMLYLGRAMRDARIPLDNNLAENALRVVAVGRKAWMFCGSGVHAQAGANRFSLIASCMLHDLDPESYLEALIRIVPYWPRAWYLELAPKYWLRTRARLDAKQLAMPVGAITVPPAEQRPAPS